MRARRMVHTEDSGKNRAGNNSSVAEGHIDSENVMNRW